MSENLKFCPFCGGEAEPFNPFGEIDGTWTVLCRECASSVGFEQTEAEAIAAWNARATDVTLTAEQVCKAVYAHSIHADCTDADWQAIADELNARAERTCECDGTISWEWTGPTRYYEHELSCGHVITSTEKEPPNYCEVCGAKAVGE